MARTYKRDSRGRFASGGGSSSSSTGKKSGGSKPAGAGDGRRGPRGGKSGTRAEQARAKKAQAARTAEFRGKSTAGRAAKAAYKAASGAVRKAAKARSAAPRDGIQQAQRALQRSTTRLQRARDTVRELDSSLKKLWKKKASSDERRPVAKKLERAKRSISRLEDASSRYKTILQREQDRKNYELAKRTRAKAPDTPRTRKNRIRTQQRKVTWLTKTRGFAAARVERDTLRGMLGMPRIQSQSAGVSVIRDLMPVSRARNRAMRESVSVGSSMSTSKPRRKRS